MKKYIIFLLGVVFLFLGATYIKLFSKQSEFQQSIADSTSPVLVLNNFDNSKIRIVTADTDKIIYSLEGSAAELISLLQSGAGKGAEIDFSGKWSEAGGTITVPKGMLLDVSLTGSRTVDINDAAGRKTIKNRNSFLIDTTNLNSFEVGKTGNVVLNGWGNLVVWDDKEWDLLSNPTDSDNGIASDNGTGDSHPYCGIGSQVIRNYCCAIQKTNTAIPACNGTGGWVFDNSTRDCSYTCNIIQTGGSETDDASMDCGVGAQSVRNNCCAARAVGQYEGCVGFWNYNNAARNCVFVCSSSVPTDDENGSGGGSPAASYDDVTSNYCSKLEEASDQNSCCNDALKNGLSSGPHPGYPDCIGTWNFDIDAGCKFKCAEYTEMMKILDEIRKKARNLE